MQPVSDTHHLVRRSNGVWYFRRRVPKHLVAVFNANVIQVSLGTTDKKKAKQLREVEDVKWSAQFDAAESASNSPSPLPNPEPLSEQQLARLIQDYVDRMDRKLRSRYAPERLGDEQTRKEAVMDIEIGLETLTNLDDPRGDERVHAVGNKILSEVGKRVDDADVPFAAFAQLVRRALLELDRRSLAVVSDDRTRSFFDQFFNPQRQPDTTFGELTQQFLQLKLEDAQANHSGKKYKDKIQAHVNLIQEIIGADTSVATIDFDMCMMVRTTLSRMPSNRPKIYGALPLEQVLKKASNEGRPLLRPITQQEYLRVLEEVLNLALKKRLIPSNPAAGLTSVERDSVAAADKRLPFEPDQLAQFFHSAFYKECAASGPQPFKHDKDGWRFWLPLICLFTGMRPNEVCQLHLNDIRETSEGTWYFDVVIVDYDAETDEGTSPTSKKLKTPTSRRKIPLHPELLKIGLLLFVQQQRNAKSIRLFPTLKPDASGYYSTYPTKRFRETFADSDEVARSYRSYLARDSEMISPTVPI